MLGADDDDKKARKGGRAVDDATATIRAATSIKLAGEEPPVCRGPASKMLRLPPSAYKPAMLSGSGA
jgi:hypothetical protein